MTFQRLQPLVLEEGLLEKEAFGRLLARMGSPDFTGISNTLFLAKGKRA